MGMARQSGLARKALVALGLDAETLKQAMGKALESADPTIVKSLIPTPRVKRVIEMAFDEARRGEKSYVGTNHMLIALLAEGEGIGAQVLRQRDLTVDRVRAELDRLEATGAYEQAGKPGPPRQGTQRHLKIPDQRGRVIELYVTFPAEYSAEECQAAIDRIQAALL